MSTEHKYPRTATTDIGTKYRVTYPGAIPEFHHDNGTWMNSEDYMTERMLFDDPRAHETTAKPPAPALDPLTADVIVKARAPRSGERRRTDAQQRDRVDEAGYPASSRRCSRRVRRCGERWVNMSTNEKPLVCTTCDTEVTAATAFAWSPSTVMVPYEQAVDEYADLPPLKVPVDPKDQRDDGTRMLRMALPLCKRCAKELVNEK